MCRQISHLFGGIDIVLWYNSRTRLRDAEWLRINDANARGRLIRDVTPLEKVINSMIFERRRAVDYRLPIAQRPGV
jgi:hypothetical protein